jgi:hypothetical protein
VHAIVTSALCQRPSGEPQVIVGGVVSGGGAAAPQSSVSTRSVISGGIRSTGVVAEVHPSLAACTS